MFKRSHFPAAVLVAVLTLTLAVLALGTRSAHATDDPPADPPVLVADPPVPDAIGPDACYLVIPGALAPMERCPLSPDYVLADGPYSLAAERCVNAGGRVIVHTSADRSPWAMCSGLTYDDPCAGRYGSTFWAIEGHDGSTLWISGDPRGRCGDHLNVLTTRSRCLAAQSADGFECLSIPFGRGALYWNEWVDY